MSQKPSLDFRLARRLAIEKQLLAEEKWVVEALKKIKKQRNSLQMERLHLNSLLVKLILKKRGKSETCLQEKEEPKQQEETPLASFSLDLPSFNPDDLNLTVPRHDYSNSGINTEIEEFENEEIDMEDFEIDMNMLMNGQP